MLFIRYMESSNVCKLQIFHIQDQDDNPHNKTLKVLDRRFKPCKFVDLLIVHFHLRFCKLIMEKLKYSAFEEKKLLESKAT